MRGKLMPRKPSRCTQAEIARVFRAVAQTGVSVATKFINIGLVKALGLDRNVLWGDA